MLGLLDFTKLEVAEASSGKEAYFGHIEVFRVHIQLG